MLSSEDVLQQCSQKPREQESEVLDTTPSATECAARLKRQRLLDAERVSSAGSGSSTESSWAPNKQHMPIASAASPGVPARSAASLPWQASQLLDYVLRCLQALNALHPVTAFIVTETRAADMACALFRRVYLMRSVAQRAELCKTSHAQVLLAASLWVAIKFEATRPTTPDSGIMSRITGIPAAFLCQQERQLLADLDWDVVSVAREVGAVGCVDLSDASSQEQQIRLAALAQPAFDPQAALPELLPQAPTPAADVHQAPRRVGATGSKYAALLAHAGSLPMRVASNLLGPAPVPKASC